jgi:hypothetical protein
VCLSTIKEVANLSLIPPSVTDSIVEWISGLKKSSDGTNAITMIAIGAAVLVVALVVMVSLYMIAKRFPKVMSLFESLKD